MSKSAGHKPQNDRTNRNTSGSGKWTQYTAKKVEPEVELNLVDSASVWAAIKAVISAGDALLIAATSNGGCIVFTVCSGQERIKFYARSVDEVHEQLATIENIASD